LTFDLFLCFLLILEKGFKMKEKAKWQNKFVCVFYFKEE